MKIDAKGDVCYYILDGKKVVREYDLLTWGKWFEKTDRSIGRTRIKGYLVCTDFLGLDHSYDYDNAIPIIFEVMIKDVKNDNWLDYCVRCCEYDDALLMHKRAVGWLRHRLRFGQGLTED